MNLLNDCICHLLLFTCKALCFFLVFLNACKQ